MEATKKYFYGNEISEYGVQHNRVDFRTFAKAFDAVYAGSIIEDLSRAGFYFEPQNGNDIYFEDYNGNRYTYEEKEELIEKLEDLRIEMESNGEEDSEKYSELLENIEALQEEHFDEVFQYFIVSSNATDLLDEANQLYWYCEDLDMYIWGVTHWGTSWDYVLTDIAID